MKLCVIGTGYVGLVTGACFAETGNDVICVDTNKEKIAKLLRGEIPIHEPGLDVIVKKNSDKKRLSFTTDVTSAVQASEVCFIAVGTPPGEDGSADLSYVLQAAKDIGQAINGYKIIVDKSTVPVGTAEKVREAIKAVTTQDFDVVSNPEFLKEGAAINDFMKPERIIIGAESEKAFEIMDNLYSPFIRTGAPVIKMDTRSAELAKYAANAMLATKISFMNEIANLCELVGANIDLVRKGIGSDSRIGNKFLFAGIGYGGSCFPKDVKAIIKTAEEQHYPLQILQAVDTVNKKQKMIIIEKVRKHFKELKGKTFAIWGLAYKPQTDDMREAPAVTIINALLSAGAKIQATDPEAMNEARKIFGDKITYFEDNYEALLGADALLVLTEWNEYREPDFERITTNLKSPVIFDGRNVYTSKFMQEKKFTYYSIGRP